MAVSCKRVGCRVPATTTVIIDPPASRVTLVDVEAAPMGVTLCSVHATAVTAPMGWVLDDDRGADLRLLAVARPTAVEPVEEPPPATPGAPAPPGPARPRRRRPADRLPWADVAPPPGAAASRRAG